MSLNLILILYSILLGLIIGSFLNVVISRLPQEKSVGGRSACPKCNNKIAWYDNFPVVSFLLLRGKCRHCQAPISFLYPFVEVLTALLSYQTFMWAEGDFVNYLLWFILFISPLIAVIFIDFKHQIIPDKISLPGMPIGIALQLYLQWPNWQEALLFSGKGILIGGGFLFGLAYLYMAIRKREGMGGGDIKLLGLLGAFLGWQAIPFILLSSSLLAIIYALFSKMFSGNKEEFVIPYGPFLVAAAFLFLFYGQQIISFYLNHFIYR